MKKLFICLLLIVNVQLLSAQDFDFHYDHYSFIVKDLKTVGDFYKNILKLKEISHPRNDPNYRWFQVRGNAQLHLIGKDSVTMEHSKSVHLCLATQHLDDFMAHLKANKIEFSDWPGTPNAVTDRADGVRQIYLKDPENNWIEINTAKH